MPLPYNPPAFKQDNNLMNPRLALLHDYPFQKLARLLEDIQPPENRTAIKWSVGEPKHPAPEIVLDAIRAWLEPGAR